MERAKVCFLTLRLVFTALTLTRRTPHTLFIVKAERNPQLLKCCLCRPGLETKNFLRGQLLYVRPYMSAARGPNVFLCILFTHLLNGQALSTMGLFHIACTTYSCVSDTCYNICGYGRHRFGSVDRKSVCGLKGPRFNSGQKHVHWLRAHPQCGMCKRQLVNVSLSSTFLTLYPSAFLSVENQ